LGNVEVSFLSGKVSARTGGDGTARISLPDNPQKSELNLLVAHKGSDVAILPELYANAWLRRPAKDDLRWYVFDDRGLYRPGEEVHLKGWIRRLGAGSDGDVGSLSNAATNVEYTLRDSRNNEISKGLLPINSFGAFDFLLKLPPTMNLGFA